MYARQRQAMAEWNALPGFEAIEVEGIGIVIINRYDADRAAHVTLMNNEGGQGFLAVRLDAGAEGRFGSEPTIGISGFTTDPAVVLQYARLIQWAAESVLPTLVRQ